MQQCILIYTKIHVKCTHTGNYSTTKERKILHCDIMDEACPQCAKRNKPEKTTLLKPFLCEIYYSQWNKEWSVASEGFGKRRDREMFVRDERHSFLKQVLKILYTANAVTRWGNSLPDKVMVILLRYICIWNHPTLFFNLHNFANHASIKLRRII